MNRLTIFSGAGLVTFTLFVLMASLVNQQHSGIINELPYMPVTVMQIPPESRANNILRTLPKLPEIQPPRFDAPTAMNAVQGSDNYNYQPVAFNIENSAGDIDVFAGRGEGDASPLVRTTPTYPLEAARNGIEGWVILSFDINEIGEVLNIAVVDAEPKRTFDRAAKQALRKWKYRAKVLNGQPIIQQGMTVQLDFTMQNQ